MIVKTITCHNVYNYGASLQELALIKFLEKYGHEVETISYKPDYLRANHEYFSFYSEKWNKSIFHKCLYVLYKLPYKFSNRDKRKAFDIFSKEYIKSTKVEYRTNEELKNNLPCADAYICGSDQIWNPIFKNGHDKAFYLDFAPAGKKKSVICS